MADTLLLKEIPDKLIIQIVTQAREDFEKGRIDPERLAKLYLRYCPLGDVDHFVSIAGQLFPNLNCGLASVYLREQLGGEVIRGRYQGHGHSFLFLNGRVIDITADQFRGPKIYVGYLRWPWCLGDGLALEYSWPRN